MITYVNRPMITYVNRPSSRSRHGEMLAAILTTVENEKAIVVSPTPHNWIKIQSTVRASLRRHGYLLHYVTQHDNSVVAWAEPLNSAK